MTAIFEYLTMWTLVIFVGTLLVCGIFPRVLPIWFFIGVACLMTSIGIVGSMVFNTISLHNDPTRDSSDVARDYAVHVLPLLVLILFYPLFQSRFYCTGESPESLVFFAKSAAFPFIVSLIYVCTHDVEEVYKMSNLPASVIIITTLCVWLASYPVFSKSFKE